MNRSVVNDPTRQIVHSGQNTNPFLTTWISIFAVFAISFSISESFLHFELCSNMNERPFACVILLARSGQQFHTSVKMCELHFPVSSPIVSLWIIYGISWFTVRVLYINSTARTIESMNKRLY